VSATEGGELVVVARFAGVFGLRGELKCRPTPAGESALAAGRDYALGAEANAPHVRIAQLRRVNARLVVALEGVATPEAARAYVGKDLYASREALALGPDEYLDADLVGLQLIDERGTPLGAVVGVEHYPAQDCLVVGAQRALVPMVKAFIRKVDLAGGTIVVDLPEGLL